MTVSKADAVARSVARWRSMDFIVAEKAFVVQAKDD
jgi:hypothetical protein